MAFLAGPCHTAGAGAEQQLQRDVSRVPGTGVTGCFDDSKPIACPSAGQPYYGQDGNSPKRGPSFETGTDGTARDVNTGLMWAREVSGPMTWEEANATAKKLRIGGHSDWRLPTIKELYSLIDFGRGYFSASAKSAVPFLDTEAFSFAYSSGERFFDVQLWSSTRYVATTMNNDATVFGVNFADGRIKGYPLYKPGSGGRIPQQMRVRFVRGTEYGRYEYRDNGDGTVSDVGSGLSWQQVDDGVGRNWQQALAYCASLRLAGASDWRLPNAKELHTIIDYSRAPATDRSAALAPPLRASTPELYFWSSTTIADGPPEARYGKAVYFAFGRAMGWMQMPPGSSQARLIDVHGAGAQRADFKSGDPAQYPRGFGPQGDDVRILNAVRCVRG
jgi:hypothetical protein